MRKYWLTYNENNELCGYSTYKQFKDQTCVDEIPEMFITEQNRIKDIVEGKKILADTLEAVLEYLEDIADETTPKLTKQEFKDLCLERKNARIKVKS